MVRPLLLVLRPLSPYTALNRGTSGAIGSKYGSLISTVELHISFVYCFGFWAPIILPFTFTSKMAKRMDPMLPTLSVLGYWEPLFWALLELQAVEQVCVDFSRGLLHSPGELHRGPL